jgi:putative transposase
MDVQELRRMRELEQENARLKKIVANQSLDIDILKDLVSKKY